MSKLPDVRHCSVGCLCIIRFYQTLPGVEHKRCGADRDASYGSTGAPQVATSRWMVTTQPYGFIRWSTSEYAHLR
ncbi:hypothetical protein [Methanohalobium evestigatum]|uniref:hypothetical protein n=1 Tax=Methanohalobium evestigatum TaxID=2322 RepID=UPI0012F657A1|nr:hypothetical protein [Methanohalobium evestigatum]